MIIDKSRVNNYKKQTQEYSQQQRNLWSDRNMTYLFRVAITISTIGGQSMTFAEINFLLCAAELQSSVDNEYRSLKEQKKN
jgi:hypothetical protein